MHFLSEPCCLVHFKCLPRIKHWYRLTPAQLCYLFIYLSIYLLSFIFNFFFFFFILFIYLFIYLFMYLFIYLFFFFFFFLWLKNQANFCFQCNVSVLQVHGAMCAPKSNFCSMNLDYFKKWCNLTRWTEPQSSSNHWERVSSLPFSTLPSPWWSQKKLAHPLPPSCCSGASYPSCLALKGLSPISLHFYIEIRKSSPLSKIWPLLTFFLPFLPMVVIKKK